MKQSIPVTTRIVKQDGTPTEDFVFFLNNLNNNSGGGSVPATVPDSLQMFHRFRTAYYTSYTEITYSSGAIAAINVWKDSSKATKLFEETLTWSSGKITKLEIKDIEAGKTLTVNFNYTGDSITSIERSIV